MGIVYGIASKAQDYLFAGSMYEGVFTSGDNGENWTGSQEGLLNINIMCILCSPDGRILAGTQSGLYYSEDNGRTWNLMGLEYDFIQALAVDSSGYIFAGMDDGLYRSGDNGTTWDYIQYFNNASIWSMVVVPTTGYLYVGTYGRGVAYTADHGETWPGNWLDFVCALTADKQGNVYAGLSDGMIQRYSGPGSSWEVIQPEFLNASVWGLVVDENSYLYAGTNGAGVLRKSLSGTDWEEINTGFDHLDIISMCIGPTGSVFAGTSGDGIYIFRSSENRWEQAGIPIAEITSLLPLQDGRLLAGHTGYGVYRTDDLGYTWSQGGPEMEYVRCMAQAPDGTIFAGTSNSDNDGIYQSDDSGETWTVSINSLADNAFFSLACLSADTIVAGMKDGVLISTDHGDSWKQAGPDTWFNCLLYLPGHRLLIAGTWSGQYNSYDHGETWVNQTNELEGQYVTCMVKNSAGLLFAGTGAGPTDEQGIFRSADNGETWTRVCNGLISTDVRALTVDMDNHLYAGILYGGVYVSTNNGNSWTPVLSGLSDLEIGALAFHPDGYVFAGIRGGSVYRNNHQGSSPSVATTAISGVTNTSAMTGGDVTSDGGAAVTGRGVCWSTALYPTTDDEKITEGSGTGPFTVALNGLSPGITYHVRAWATNREATSYGKDIDFITQGAGMDEPASIDLRLYPNPGKGPVTMQFDDEYSGEVTIELIDPLGKVLKTYQYLKYSYLFNEKLEFPEIRKGCYFLRFCLDKKVFQTSLIRL